MVDRRSPRTRALVAAVAIGGLANPVGAGGQVAPTVPVPATACAQPYPATFAARTYPAAEPVVLPWADGTRLGTVPAPIDTDGDGTADTLVDLTGGGFTITRASGTLAFPASASLANRFDPADLDGDGGTDLIVSYTGAGQATYVVPGATADGSIDAAEAGSVGIGVPLPVTAGRAVGDQDGDGITDLAVNLAVDGTGPTELHGGADLTAPGPGGTYSGDPIERLDGALVGIVPAGGSAPLLITSPDVATGGPAVRFDVRSAPATALTTSGTELSLPARFADGNAVIGVEAPDGHLWLVLEHIDRGGAVAFGWDLADPCRARPVPPEERPPAPVRADPAVPVAATADYTG